jgi:23S rRNA pseudouridine2605 synthase
MTRPPTAQRGRGGKAAEQKESTGRVRLQRVLADAGIAARRVCEQLIEQGRVVVNGHKMTKLPVFVDPASDRITVDGKPIPPPQEKVYILLHKPARTIVATADEPGLERRTALDLVDHPASSRLFPVGRLDFDTTGLLLLTNDGDFANIVTHPSKGVKKVYHAWVKGFVTDEMLAKIRRQSKLVAKAAMAEKRKAAREAMGAWAATELPQGKRKTPVTPIEARLLRVEEGKSVLEVELIDNRAPLRDVLLSAGLDVRKLVRVRIGTLDLKGVAPAQWRELTYKEVRSLMKAENPRKPVQAPNTRGRGSSKPGETTRAGTKAPISAAAAQSVEQAAQRALAVLAQRGPTKRPARGPASNMGQDAVEELMPRVNRRAAGNDLARERAAGESFSEPTRRKPRTLLPD